MKKTILLLTDYLTMDKEYIDKLKEKYDVKVTSFSLTALHYLVRKPWEISLFILGIENPMENYKRWISKVSVFRKAMTKLPVIFWTSVDDDKTREYIAKINDGFLVKQEPDTDHLTLAVSDIFGDSK